MNRNIGESLLRVALVLAMFVSLAAAQEAHDWGYAGEHGPDHWGGVCSTGGVQSPIDIVSPEKTKLPVISVAYNAVPLKVINNGHTLQVNYAPGSSITRDGKTYDLVQFHFHHMSENAIKGKHQPMELHLVHKDKDGNLAVVGVMLKEGKANKSIETVWNNLPATEGAENAPGSTTVNAAGLLPGKRSYYNFPGSLTTPPCSEGVTWLLLTKPMTVSKQQIAKFAAVFPNNARPVQPLNGRKVLESK